jgi:hypothetical protein
MVLKKPPLSGAKNLPLKNKLDKENERELKKLAEISAKPDQTAQALLKLGEIFFNAGKYNESRVVITHVTPFLGLDDEKMRALYYKTMGYVVQNAMDPALKGYEAFQAAYKGEADRRESAFHGWQYVPRPR